jgi:hypothetical protein
MAHVHAQDASVRAGRQLRRARQAVWAKTWRSARREAATAAVQNGLSALYGWLDAKPFPAIVAYATHRLHIVALMGVLGALMLDNNPLVQLKLGNYTNVVSALVACIVLLQQVAHRRETRAMHEENQRLHQTHAAEVAALHAKVDRITKQVAPRAARGKKADDGKQAG